MPLQKQEHQKFLKGAIVISAKGIVFKAVLICKLIKMMFKRNWIDQMELRELYEQK